MCVQSIFDDQLYAAGQHIFDTICYEEPESSTGGGRIQKPSTYNKTIRFEEEYYKIEVPSILVEETSLSYQNEIERHENAALMLGFQIQAAQLELEIYKEKDALRYKALDAETERVKKFIDDLLLSIISLRSIMKRRKEEEELLLILMIAE